MLWKERQRQIQTLKRDRKIENWDGMRLTAMNSKEGRKKKRERESEAQMEKPQRKYLKK